jgi:hypothetical protein
VAEYEWESPKHVGYAASKNLTQFELFLKQDVDNYVMRLSCAPEVQRPNGIRLHEVFDREGLTREVVVMRMWEASTLKENLPSRMYNGNISYETAAWECISLDWASKDLEEEYNLPRGEDLQQRLQVGEIERSLENHYPVWYFLTGTISRPSKIKALWKLHEAPYARWATVHGFVKIRDRHCEGLVHCSKVDKYMNNTSTLGVAYLVNSQLAENRLRYYKTSLFEVVRCKIKLHPLTDHGQEHEVDGLTFIVCDGEAGIHKMAGSSTESIPDAAGGARYTASTRSVEFEGSYMDPRESNADLVEGSEVEPDDGSDEATSLDEDLENHRLPFPILRQGREGSAFATSERRMMLLSPSRPRSSLIFVENAEDMRSSPDSAINNPEENDVSEHSCSSEAIHGRRQSGSKAALEVTEPWWEQSLRITTKSYTEVSSSQSEHPNTSELSEDEGIWMASGGGSCASSETPSAMSTTSVSANQWLYNPVHGTSEEHQGFTPAPGRPAVTVREISDIEAEIDDMANPGNERPRFDSTGQQWPLPRGRSKSF